MNATKSLDAPIYHHMSLQPAHDATRASLSDRRHSLRGPVQSKAKVALLDGDKPGAKHDVLTRDASLSGISFLLRESWQVGQQCEIEFEANGHPARKFHAEVVRSRPISAGRFEMAVQFRKQV